MYAVFFSVLTGLLVSAQALAIPEAPFNALTTEVLVSDDTSLSSYDFNGIVALSNCSASLIHFAGQPKSSQAYVLTNGHCIGGRGFLRPGEVRFNQSVNRGMRAHKTINERVRVSANTLVYATMTDTDSALYRLNETYEELEALGIFSFELAWEQPAVGQPLHIVSGYWKRGFECSIEKIVYQLLESDWTFTDSIRYSESGCEVYGGTSGSPVIAKGERLVIGVNNTGNESGRSCTMNNPCEVDEDGNRLVLQGRGYAQQTYWFYSCLNEAFEIDLEVESCRLPKP